MKKLDEVFKKDEVPRADAVDHGIVDHDAKRQDEEHRDAQKARRKIAETAEKISPFFTGLLLITHIVDSIP